MYTIDKKISRSIAAAALCAALAFGAPSFADTIDHGDVRVKVPAKTDVPLDAESVENVKENAKKNYGSSMTDGAALSTESGGEINLYQSSFEVLWTDQWRTSLKRYGSIKDADGSIKIRRTVDLASSMKPPFAEERDLRFWSYKNNNFVDLDANKDEFAELTAMNDFIKIKSGDELVSWDLSASPRADLQSFAPVDAYIRWLKGYDFSYGNALVGSGDAFVEIKRSHGLADIGQGSMVINGPPDIYDSLPGYQDWARDSRRMGRTPYLYAQTNDGIFHVVDATNMKEISALILPSSLLPGRLAAAKVDEDGAWIDVSGDESVERSRPVYLLDGPMQLRHFNMKNSDNAGDWRTYLIGTLGRAGNGIYMMDVDDPASPKLMWYRETIHDYSESNPGNDGWVEVEDGSDPDNNLDTVTMLYSDAGSSPKIERRKIKWEGHNDEVDVRDPAKALWPAWMGFNMPKPGAAVVGTVEAGANGEQKVDLRNIIVLGGGLKSKIVRHGAGVDRRFGAEGSAIYILDAKTGDMLKMFNSRSKSINDPNFYDDLIGNDGKVETNVGNVGAIKSGMDMVVSEPTFVRTADSRYIASGVILCTHAGKILLVRFGGEGEESNPDPKTWRIGTLADIDDLHVLHDISSSSAVTHGVAITRGVGDTTKDIWVAGVTSNTMSRTDMGGRGDLSNMQQQIFSFKDSLDPNENEPYQMFYNWKELEKDDESIFTEGDAAYSSDGDGLSGFADEASGWRIILDPEEWRRYAAEYGTTRPLIAKFKGRQVMFVATFKQGLTPTTRSVSNLYALDVETGAPMLWSTDDIDKQTKSKSFSGIKINGLTLSEQGGRTTILVTYDKTDAANDVNDRLNDKGDKEFLHKVGDSDDIDAFVIDLGRNSMVRFNDGSSIVDYWMTK